MQQTKPYIQNMYFIYLVAFCKASCHNHISYVHFDKSFVSSLNAIIHAVFELRSSYQKTYILRIKILCVKYTQICLTSSTLVDTCTFCYLSIVYTTVCTCVKVVQCYIVHYFVVTYKHLDYMLLQKGGTMAWTCNTAKMVDFQTKYTLIHTCMPFQ